MSAPTKKHIYVRKMPDRPYEVVPPSWRRGPCAKDLSHYVHSDLFDEVIGEREACKSVLRKMTEDLVDKVVAGYTLYMAALRNPGDIARNKDRDEAVVYLVREDLLTEEQLHNHLNVMTRRRIEEYSERRTNVGP